MVDLPQETYGGALVEEVSQPLLSLASFLSASPKARGWAGVLCGLFGLLTVGFFVWGITLVCKNQITRFG